MSWLWQPALQNVVVATTMTNAAGQLSGAPGQLSELEPPGSEPPVPPLPGGRPNNPSNSLPPAPAAVSAKPFTMPMSGSALRLHESWYDFAPAFISSPTEVSASSSRRG